MSAGGYLTIEETARKLGKPVSWVKDQICEGNLGATLADRRWLISPQDLDELMLNYPPTREPDKIVHNFLPDRPRKRPQNTQNDQQSASAARKSTNERASRSPSSTNSRPKKGKAGKPSLVQKIEDLDKKFEQLTTRLKKAMLKYKATIRAGKQTKPPRNLIHQWRTAKAELQHLIAEAETRRLWLPTNLTIHKVLAQEAETAKNTARKADAVATKSPTMVKGIDGYSARLGPATNQDVRKAPSHVEARLTILRSRERAAAHSMQDRGKSQAAREAAANTWAQVRREAEMLEREFRAVRRTD